jgi:TolB-like protein
MLALCLGCAGSRAEPIYHKDGNVYGTVEGAFRHRWWNYYERALSYAEGAVFNEAVSDLNEAIQQRDKDQRMARTYGMHFVDYFPHRELGLIYYQLGDLINAEKELELSLSQFVSAKAGFYLDKVRSALIEMEGKEIAPPNMTLDTSGDEIWTRKDPVIVSGIAQDDHFISDILINHTPLFSGGSKKRVPFEKSLFLEQGNHRVCIEVINLAGKKSKREIMVHVDREGPIVTLDNLRVEKNDEGFDVELSAYLYDPAGVSTFRANDHSLPIQQAEEVSYAGTIRIVRDRMTLVAEDRLGNKTTAEISMTENSRIRAQGRPQGFCGESERLLASAGSVKDGQSLLSFLGKKDDLPPMINLPGWTTSQTVFLEKIYLDGTVTDNGTIEDLAISGRSILRRKGNRVFFGHLLELNEGENTIVIQAADQAGNTAVKSISITRKIPKALQLQERMSMTVLPFDQKGEVAPTSLSFQDNLIDAVVNLDRFRVVERDKLEAVLQEQKLSRTELVDRKTALKMGRLVAAQSILTGRLIETRLGIEIVARLIDTETSEILAVMDVYDEIKDIVALKGLAEGLAVKIHREFPLLDGIVLKHKGKYIFTDLGQEKVKLQRRLIVFRQEPIIHPATGKQLGSDNEIIGRARVTQVSQDSSKAELLDHAETNIESFDRVMTE